MVKAKRGAFDHQPTSLDRTSTLGTPNAAGFIALDDKTWDAFIDTLDATMDPNPSLKERFADRPLWDRNSDRTLHPVRASPNATIESHCRPSRIDVAPRGA